MGLSCGIVGLPNVGKSTLFNALTQSALAEAANYPFCTIEPNKGSVPVPDARLHALAALAQSQQVIPAAVDFVDVAGLVKGAGEGEGLGNKFLGHIRETDAVCHVVRCFDDGDVTHVEGGVDPLRDVEIIETELMLSDLASTEKRVAGCEKKAKSGDKESKALLSLLERVHAQLAAGLPASTAERAPEEAALFKSLGLITSKPLMYICNVSERDVGGGNAHTAKVEALAERRGAKCVRICAKAEEEIAALDSDEEKKEFLSALGLEEAGLARVIRAGYGLLDLITYFTVGPKEARAWTVKSGSRAPAAAGVIHTDFEKGFIRAETIAYDDYIAGGGEKGAKEAGKLRLEGKDYVVQDGDVLHFRFNV
ncbi:MAG: redox-regulated ATPase YchF [Rickettsiales bacterium]